MQGNTNLYTNIELIVDNDYIRRSMQLIESAESEIILSTFKIQTGRNKRTEVLRDMIQLLNDKLKDGIKVMLLLNWIKNFKGVARTNEPVANALRAFGADVRYLKDGRCCHSKLLMIDKSQFIIGSHNWSAASLQENYEMSLFVNSVNMAKVLRNKFLQTFGDAEKWL